MALTYQQAVDLIVERASKRTFDDAAVQSLALCFKTVGIRSPVLPSVVGGKVEPYAVLGEDNLGKPRVVFQRPGPTGGSTIPSAFAVPTVAATDMDQVDVTENLITVQVPAFNPPTDPPTKNTWKLLDLGDVTPAPQVIITTQLTGCTFAIGTVGNKYYMGHTKPPSSSTAPTGEKHGNDLRKGPVFNGILPVGTILESKFFIQPGNTSEPNSIAYAPARQAVVLGFVVGATKVSFIVQIVKVLPFEVGKVFVVTHEAGASEWTITPVP